MASPSGQGSCGDVGEALVTPKEEVIAPEDEPDQPSVGPGDAGSDSAAMNISGETDAANGSASESTVTAEESDPATSDQYPCSFVVVQRCVFCSATLTLSEKSKLLECLHAVCASCLLGWSEGCAADVVPAAVPPKKLCPECQVTSRYNHLIDNKFLLEVGVLPSSINNNNSGGGGGGNNNNNGSGDSGSGGGGSGGGASSTESTDSSEIKCNNCPDVLATDWCDNCRDYICEACTTAHKQLACTKDHIIRPKDNIYIQKDRSGFENYPCPLHPKELLLLYCNSCGSLTCRDCQLSQFHRTHNYCFVDEIVDDAKNEMKALLNEVQYKSEIIDAAIGILDERTRKIAIKKSEILKEIKDIVTKLTELVSKTGKDLMFALNEACSTKLEVHRTHKKTLVAISKQAAHCTEFVKKALASSSNNCLLFSKQ
ncbi:hypothetical protein AAG570_007398 [Ranatra chinensis]|uniref:Uncharacterized protein n=1 Tax=Ranatra chinensis TaxID=642074 RepID=A0ABD0Y8S1_9HEMI